MKDNEAAINSMSTIENDYLRIQSENEQLLQQQQANEDNNMNLVAEGIKIAQQQAVWQKKGELFTEKLQKVEQKCSANEASIESSRKTLQQLEDQLHKIYAQTQNLQQLYVKKSRPIRLLSLNASEWIIKLVQYQEELEFLKGQNLGSQELVDKEITLHGKLLEEQTEIKKRLDHYIKNGSGADPYQLKKLEQYKKLVRCSVCHERQKNVIITRCNHTFCRECIQSNIQNRHRKCPSCCGSFGEGDVRTIYL
eukprot:TRINITY_DN13860_c0_g1_i2.p1 TRINITY_DN13860_c0_g1~~TRINITY_DN13860_c0_g1_i2.p1  ORF type:complete len:252 (+),score=64.63 TRINITY_DN13860_c0_g1_i2:395-1150(+)